MTIDERLEKLTERHEALSQTVELIAARQLHNDEILTQVMEGIARLVHVAELHETRITGVEERLDQK
jgi:hypothetical protein